MKVTGLIIVLMMGLGLGLQGADKKVIKFNKNANAKNNKKLIYTPEQDVVARVISSEASEKCSQYERRLVYSVIYNRLKNNMFANGRLKNMFQVVMQHGHFQSVSSKNSNWRRKGVAYKNALTLITNKSKPIHDKILFFHDKSVKNPPKTWGNVKMVIKTRNFRFYGALVQSGCCCSVTSNGNASSKHSIGKSL